MFHGKGLGKNTYQYFTAQMNIAVKRRMTLESALRRAVMQKDFVLHYQPQINLESGEIIAVEALVRWKTEDSGTVMPGDFIPLAEETGLINEIGEWVLREGCRQAKEWQGMGLGPPAHGDQPVGAPVQRPRLPRHGRRACSRKPGSSRRGWSWRSPRAR